MPLFHAGSFNFNPDVAALVVGDNEFILYGCGIPYEKSRVVRSRESSRAMMVRGWERSRGWSVGRHGRRVCSWMDGVDGTERPLDFLAQCQRYFLYGALRETSPIYPSFVALSFSHICLKTCENLGKPAKGDRIVVYPDMYEQILSFSV